jgi:HAE1 family hydrophobic/amphiphilic exporter-1
VAISQFVDFERIYGPEAVSRFNMLKSDVNGKSNPGFSSDIAVQEVCYQNLYLCSLIDQRRNYSRKPSNWFLLSLIFVYFLLSLSTKVI